MSGVSVRASSPVLAWTVAAGVVVLAASSFALSFSALAELAIASGVPDHLAFLWPVIVDGFIVVATLAAFSFSARPGRVQLYPWMALGVFAIVSVAGNALHVQTLAPGTVVVADWIAVTVASVPPVALLIASHLLVVMISGRPEVYEPAHVTAQPEAALTVAEPLAQPSRMPNAAWSSRGAHNVAALAKSTDGARIVEDESDLLEDAAPVAAPEPVMAEALVEAPEGDLADFLHVPERFTAVGAPLEAAPVRAATEARPASLLAEEPARTAEVRAEATSSPDIDRIRTHEQQGGELTAKAIAALLNVSERTGRRKLAQYRELSA